MAIRCSTVLVEQPSAASSTRALPRLAGVRKSPGAPPGARRFHRPDAGLPRQRQPRGVDGGDGRVARQSQAETLGEATHGVGGEQSGARPAGGAGGVFELIELGGGDAAPEVRAHGFEDVLVLDPPSAVIPRQHRPAGDQRHGQVHPGGRHHHAGHHLVAVGYQHQAVHGVGPGHDLHRVGDDLAAHQGVVHALVVHGQPVADPDDIELEWDPPGLIHAELHLLGDGAQVHVAGDELVERIGHPDERPAAGPQSSRPSPSARSRER